jgi:Tol biopolymer transport system component
MASKERKMGQRKLRALLRVMGVATLIALISYASPAAMSTVNAAPGDFTRVSVSSTGAEGNAYSRDADISSDGRLVVFWSGANSLVAGDTNAWEDIFLRDLQAGTTVRVSVSSAGAQADNGSYYPAISGDGKFIAFMSDATNLVNGDTNGVSDIFLRDVQAGTTSPVSVSSSGVPANAASDSRVAISEDGRFIAFASEATNLVTGDTNGVADLFVHDRQTGETERVSLDSGEAQANGESANPSISADGRFVAFTSNATNLVSGDTNGQADVFVRDRLLGLTTRVSVNSSGVQADRDGQDPAISADGRYVVFSSLATNLFDEEPFGYPHIFVHDRQTGETALVTVDSDGWQMVGTASSPVVSADGRYIAYDFDDRGDGLAFWEIYLHDRLTGITTSISGPGGSEEDSSFRPSISAAGDFVAFASLNSSLVTGDTNGEIDVFVRELAITTPITKTLPSNGDYDGWVIEAAEDAETGIRIDAGAATFFLGDANNDQQYRSLLHFDTGSLPNSAVITGIQVKIKRQGIIGENPFTTHGQLLVDIRQPFFDGAVDLEPDDFQAPADLQAVASMTGVPGGVWYSASLDPTLFSALSLTRPTQLRLRFALDDNDDQGQDIVKFFSGNAALADQPVMIVDYFLNTAGPPTVIGILRADANPTTASIVRFTVAFSEPVTGVDVTDFVLTADGIDGAAIQGVEGGGDTYTVRVGTGTGSGTIRLDLVDDDSIVDESGRELGGSGTGNGDFDASEAYTLSRPIFGDVPPGYWAWSFIETLYRTGITAGCGNGNYCPESTVTRDQMAVFLLRGIHGSTYNPPAVGEGTGFVDVPTDHWAAAWIKQLAAEGITGGCGGGNYCPGAPVTRDQMAVFLLKAKHGKTYSPPSVGDSTGFTDVPPDHWAAAWIKQLAVEGITGGCGVANYCPGNPVNRAEMAVFLVRTFNLP